VAHKYILTVTNFPAHEAKLVVSAVVGTAIGALSIVWKVVAKAWFLLLLLSSHEVGDCPPFVAADTIAFPEFLGLTAT
jgi:hypothetical protein